MIEEKPVIFVVDDDASVRKSLSRLLASHGLTVETFDSAEQFLKREPYGGTGCIILDVRMPGLSGIALQDELIRTGHYMPIIFITGHGDIPMSVEAMKKGASDFLTKPFEEAQLMSAVQGALQRSAQYRLKRTEAEELQKRIDRLTPREKEILPYIIAGMLNKQIAFKLDIAEKTIKVHRGHIMEKLGVGSVAELVRLADKANIKPFR
ncbi:MAG: response regulator transcription factor [Syntrophorhabdaceae bacterium]|nr:response regulator transcription factor [Syntrophorhabdaceae bacterium]MDD4197046.1 response regulator transcription factor [Syntrophorhabdaceae bacterium]HOC45662.1 response regulator transcription factor [Syntrophorhabdaceae bacterium]